MTLESPATAELGGTAEILKALGHPLRLAIVFLLLDGERNVTEICESLEAPQAVISQQLKVLKLNRLAETRRAGNQSFYRVADDKRRKLKKILGCLIGCRQNHNGDLG
jgi:DNA-binding transcriptional ArsR family regulator